MGQCSSKFGQRFRRKVPNHGDHSTLDYEECKPCLTNRQKNLIRSTWAAFREGPGQKDAAYMLLILFTNKPDSLSLFKLGHGSTGKDLLDNESLQKRVAMVTEQLTLAVNNLNDLDTVAKDAFKVGKRHVPFGNRPEYLQDLAFGIVYALKRKLRADMSTDAKRAWLEALKFYFMNVEKGMIAGGARRKTTTSYTSGSSLSLFPAHSSSLAEHPEEQSAATHKAEGGDNPDRMVEYKLGC